MGWQTGAAKGEAERGQDTLGQKAAWLRTPLQKSPKPPPTTAAGAGLSVRKRLAAGICERRYDMATFKKQKLQWYPGGSKE